MEDREQGTQHVEVLLQPDLLREQVSAGVASRHVVVVVAQRGGVEAPGCETPQGLREVSPLHVPDRTVQPFEQGAVRAREQVECLADVPAVAVQIIDDRALDDIALPLDIEGQVPVEIARIDEPHVVVRVRRCESPRPTAGLAGVDDSDTVLALYRREALEDGFTHRTAPGGAARTVFR